MNENYKRLCGRIGYHFQDEALLQQSLTHRSFNKQHNERLEFLGDSILGFVIADLLYQQFKEANEGELTRLRAHLVRGESLAEIAISLSLADYLQLGQGELKSGAFKRESILEDALEALLGAIYLDGGMSAVSAVIVNLFQQKRQALSLDDTKRDAKSQLQELLQASSLELPVYTLVKTHGKDHDQTFYTSCHVATFSITTQGKAKSRKLAEQEAAQLALIQLKRHVEHE